MNLRGLLQVNTSLVLCFFCIIPSIAQAEDYVATSQINAANGVAGLNGNKFAFDGTVTTEGLLIRDNPIIKNYESEYSYSPPIQGGYELLSPYNSKSESSLVFLSKVGFDNRNTKPNTLMLGGQTRNAIVRIKASCQNTSGGDLGGVCYQFTDMSGPHQNNRSGVGWTDGANMEISSQDNSPLDVIGGNILIDNTAKANADAPYEVQGVILKPIENVSAGATKLIASGIFGCGNGGGESHCQMIVKNGKDSQGNDIIIFNNKVTPGQYDPKTGTIEIKAPNGVSFPALTPSNNLEVKYYSADGVAYGVKFRETNVIIYPALSEKEANLIHDRMALWTNIANGMRSTEADSVDKPNYYYGYNSGLKNQNYNKQYSYTTISVETSAAIQDGYINGVLTNLNKSGWTMLNNRNEYLPVSGAPGTIVANTIKDKYDYQITYNYSNEGVNNDLRGKEVHNSNFHYYSQPTLFLGLSDKNFNLYTLQRHNSSTDSITREYDNEWDIWMHPKHDYEVSTRGLTMTWGGYEHLFAKDSYMMLLTGADAMPKGLLVEHVARAGGLEIGTDAGFGVYKWAYPMQELNNQVKHKQLQLWVKLKLKQALIS